MAMKTLAAVQPAHEAQIREFQHRDFAAQLPILSEQRISELELEAFQVALVPFHRFGVYQGGTDDARGGGQRMIVLPLTWKELMARVRREMAPTDAETTREIAGFGDIRVDLRSMEVRRSGRLVKLTAMEFKVLKFFLTNPNRVISRSDLLDQVWGYENYPSTRTVDNHILRLRRKLEAGLSQPAHFRTVHGVGYKFTP